LYCCGHASAITLLQKHLPSTYGVSDVLYDCIGQFCFGRENILLVPNFDVPEVFYFLLCYCCYCCCSCSL
jgi:hypothetical protein